MTAITSYSDAPPVLRVFIILLVAISGALIVNQFWKLAPEAEAIASASSSMSKMKNRPAGPGAGNAARGLPDFQSISDVNQKKELFFDFLHGFVERENRQILETRRELQEFAAILTQTELSAPEKERLGAIVSDYRLEGELDALSTSALVEELLLRVDTIPVSLVLAQAANESGWGTSRFAREANNIFGIWCFNEGCGLVPRRRAPNATHEVRKFESIEDSVIAYFRTINTNANYDHFRELRAQMREQGRSLNSLALAYGLTQYSARGEHYVSEVQAIIRYNDLAMRDRG